jgi:hypothetical protein
MSQKKRFRPACAVVVASAAFVLLALASPSARADDTINRPGNHPAYNFEVEPHLILGSGGYYDGAGGDYGLGVRFGIPIVSNGFVTTINNSVAISFGLDWVHYDWCWYHLNCSADYFAFPVTMQWNFYVAQHWSVFGEPGLVIFHGFYTGCPPGDVCPAEPTDTGVYPALYLGGRYHFNDTTALTMRLGFPFALSLGISFFP